MPRMPIQRRYWWSLRVRLIAVVLLGLLPISALLGFLWLGARERDRDNTLRSLTQTTEAVAVIADDLFAEAITLGEGLATGPLVQTMEPVRIGARLREMQERNPRYDNVILIDANGTMLTWSAPQPLPSPPPNVANRPFFQEVMARGQPVTIKTIESRNAGVLSGGVAVPIFAPAAAGSAPEPPIGLIAINFNPAHVSARLAQARLFPGQIINLIDPTGRVAVQAGRSATAVELTWEQRDRSNLPEVQAALAGQLVASSNYLTPVNVPTAAEPRLAVFAPTPHHGWVVSATWPVSTALGPTRQAELRELTIFLAIVLVMLSGAVLVSRAIITPLRRLSAQAQALGHGRFEPIPQARADDEIGELTVAFNLMGERLQRTLDDLRQERTQLELILQHLPVGVVIRGAPDGRLMLGNRRAEQIWRLPFVTGADADRLREGIGIHPDGSAYTQEDWPIRRSLRTGEVVHGETIPIRRADDTDGEILVSAAPIRDADGQIIAAVTSFHDITEQRQKDALLREREELLWALLDQFPASVAILDREMRYVLAAGRSLLQTGLSPDELVGRPISELYSSELFAKASAHAARAFAGETVSYDITEQGICLQVTMVPLHDAHGHVEHVLSVSFDVTEERARLDRVVRDEKLHALGQMAGGIAHNLNQMLALVSGYGELARESLDRNPSDHDELKRMIRIMERAAYDGGETVKRLLTFARGQGSERYQVVDVAALLHDVQQLTGPRWRDACRIEGRPVDFQVEAEPGISVVGSQASLREAITNLVFNAIDAMPFGGAIRLIARRADGLVLIDVSDSGTGMGADVRQKIFEPFFTTKGEHGTGLGLAMVFGIVRHHGGQIDVTSAPGQGTTMHLRLPAGALDQPTAQAAIGQPPAASLRVLVVDDEVRLASLAAGMLRRDGHQVIEVFSGEDALEKVRSEPPELVITDLSMGDGMNGWELAAAIAQVTPGLPVVLATGWGAAIDEEEARSRGVRAVLAKPFRIADLREMVARVMLP